MPPPPRTDAGGPVLEAAGPAGAEAAESPVLFQFLHGQDTEPKAMTTNEIQELGDAFTQHVLLRDGAEIPLTLQELVTAIESAPAPGFPRRNMFMVDEGAIPHGADPAFELNTRLVFTWSTSDADPPDILVSTVAIAGDPGSLLQLIAWSEKDRAFHYFERKTGAWGWAGNSFHALSAPTRGQGPFDSHINGSLVMKELKAPWSHWHSADSHIPRSLFGPAAEFNTDPLFQDLDGAEFLEGIVRAGIDRWTDGRFARHLMGGTLIELPNYLRQLLWCTSVNLVSSTQSFHDPSAKRFNLPSTFFFDADALDFLVAELDPAADVLPSERLTVDAQLYRDAIANSQMHILDDEEPPHEVVGDTNFAFLVPERAAEDQVVVRELVAREVLSARLALCLLLVDFSNPVFSPRRAALLRHVPASVAAGARGAALDTALIDAIQTPASQQGSPEAELLDLWNRPDILKRAGEMLSTYNAAMNQRLKSPDGVGDLLRLAASRRQVLKTRSLFEFHATLATGAATGHLAMAPDGTVIEKRSSTGEAEL
jgi:hypothetical protein